MLTHGDFVTAPVRVSQTGISDSGYELFWKNTVNPIRTP